MRKLGIRNKGCLRNMGSENISPLFKTFNFIMASVRIRLFSDSERQLEGGNRVWPPVSAMSCWLAQLLSFVEA